MCGRYRLSRSNQIVESYFDAQSDADWMPRYNIAPTQRVPIIRQNPTQPRRDISFMRWGLIPSWAKDSAGPPRINARSETAVSLPTFRDPIRHRRCLIPADGFYEWRRIGTSKRPFCFEVNRGELFAFAGLWERWKKPTGEWVESCSILTTIPNVVVATVHDRMPVILNNDDYDGWLDPGMMDVGAFAQMLRPYDASLMRCYPVSGRINQVANDDAACSTLVEIQTQEHLFQLGKNGQPGKADEKSQRTFGESR